MYNLRKLCHINYVLSKNNCCKLQTFNDMKSVISVHTSFQKCTDASNSQETSVLVYKAPLIKRIKVVKLLSLSSSMIGFAIFPHIINDLCKVNVLVGCTAGAFSAFFLSTPFMLHWITKRYVLELYFDNETKTFTAKTFNIINQIKEIKFQATDVTVPDLPGMLSSFSVKGKPMFVDANMIQDPDAYSHMMGYDKPLELTLKVDEENENTKTS